MSAGTSTRCSPRKSCSAAFRGASRAARRRPAARSQCWSELKPPPFEYHAPASVDEACALLGTLEDAKVLAGGQSLVPLLNLPLARPAHIVDINRIPNLDRIYELDGGVAVQALVRDAEVEDSEGVATICPLLSAGVRLVA